MEEVFAITKNLLAIKNKNSYDLFFFSLFKPDKISITDFSYIENSIFQNSAGHIYGLFDKFWLNTNYSDTGYLQKNITYGSVKALLRIAGGIQNVSVFENYQTNGILLNYKDGDVCTKDKTKNFKAYVFLECKRDMGVKVPILVNTLDSKITINIDGCTYLFKWSIDFACKNCRKSELEYVMTPCKNNKQTFIFKENNDCLIYNLTNYHPKDNNDNFSGLKNDQNNPIIEEYFKLRKDMRQLGEDKQINNNSSISSIYAEFVSEDKYCNPINQIDETTFIVLLCIPIVYFLTIFILCFIYCKYRRIRNNYEKLNNKENQTFAENNEKKIEI